MQKITHIVVHYTATFEDQNIGAAEIDRMHRARGWRMIGYHKVVRRDGTIEPGRPEVEVGAHVGGQNTGKIGVAWIGGLNRATGANVGVDNRTGPQTQSLIKLIHELLGRYPDARVVGHRDLAATQCPGFDVQAWWRTVKGEPHIPAPPPPATTPAVTPNVGEDITYTVRSGDTLWSISRDYGMPLDRLIGLNPLAATGNIKPGDVLFVHDDSAKSDRGARQIIASIRANLNDLEAAIGDGK